MGEANKKQGKSGVWATMKPFVNGGVSGMMSISVVQPVDMVKVRFSDQLRYINLKMFIRI